MKIYAVLLPVLFAHCLLIGQDTPKSNYKKSQFRGVWIATVRNLDWPSEPGLSIKEMKREYIEQLELLSSIGMNAVVVQVRPSGDALFPSEYEPWSEFLTGLQGKAPGRSFDPLKFMVQEAHKRCIEFHAWFNPYRGIRNYKEASISPDHIYYQHPEWFVEYGEHLYFDPGMIPARKFVEKVIADVVLRYDIDAVHFDDYYYPYRIEGEVFPDSVSFELYHGAFSDDQRDDWRRENINLLVSELFDTINQLKPWVHFGISPFGVWRNKSRDPDGSDTHTLQTNYDDLFGDAIAWMENGWLDYIVPQCYQYLGRPIMDYRVVSKWWNDHHFSVNYYIGQGPFRLGTTSRGEQWTKGNEIARQLRFNDSIPELMGSVYFRSLTFMENPAGVNDSLKQIFYKYPALAPASHHDKGHANLLNISTIRKKVNSKKIVLRWKCDDPDMVRYYVIYGSKEINNPENIIEIVSDTKIKIRREDLSLDPDSLFITSVDKFRIESEPLHIR